MKNGVHSSSERSSVGSNGLGKAIAWSGSTALITQIGSWVFTLLTARLLAPSDFGLIALAETIVPYLTILSTYGLAIWVVQERELKSEDPRAAAGVAVIIGVLVSLFCFTIAPTVAHFYDNESLVLPLRWLALCFVLDSLHVIPRGLLRKSMRFKELGLINLWISLSRGVIQVGLALLGFGYMALVCGILFRSLGEAIWLFLIAPVWPSFRWSLVLLKRILAFSIPATTSMLCWVVFSTADNIVVGKFFGVEMLGFYAMAFSLSDLPLSKFSTVVKPVALAHYSRLNDSVEKLRLDFLMLMRSGLMLIFPILLGLAFVAPEGVPLILGEHWLPMVRPFQVLCIVGLSRGFTDFISTLLLATSNARRDLAINLLGAVLLPILFVILGSKFGIEGIYFTWLGFYPALVLLSAIMLRRSLGITPLELIKAMGPGLLAAAFAIGGGYVALSLLPHAVPLAIFGAKLLGGIAGCLAFTLLFRRRIVDSYNHFYLAEARPL